MILEFSEFYALSAITNLRISGILDLSWNRRYRPTAAGFKPEGGSGLSVNDFKLNSLSSFPNYGDDLVYILTSNRYPILYVGVSTRGLSGVFGRNKRFHHHIVKVFAIEKSSSTKHTKGWQAHAVSRYDDLTIANSLDTAADDLFISIASCTSNPKDHEGFVLCSTFSAMRYLVGNGAWIMVLNTGSMKYEPIYVAFPPNMLAVWKTAV